MYKVLESNTAQKDKKKIKSMNKAIKQRFIDIFNLLQNNPYSYEFSGEDLKYDLVDYRSFELTKKDRVVFQILESDCIVKVFQYLGHYKDK